MPRQAKTVFRTDIRNIFRDRAFRLNGKITDEIDAFRFDGIAEFISDRVVRRFQIEPEPQRTNGKDENDRIDSFPHIGRDVVFSEIPIQKTFRRFAGQLFSVDHDFLRMLAFRSQKQARRRFFAFESVFHGNLAFLAVSLCPPVHFIEHFHEGHTGGIIFAVQSVSAEIERTMMSSICTR